jgi:hypothetical protein
VRKVGNKEEAINVAAARRVLDEMHDRQVTSFVSDIATDLPKYGLDQPQISLTFSSYASENTAETKAGEKPIATIFFGKAENGNVYARLEDEPFIVSVPEAALEWLMVDPLQWQPLQIFDVKVDDLTAIEVAKQNQPTVSIEKGKDKLWKLAKGDGMVNQINAQSMANTLSNLRAVRWIGPSKPDFGFDKAPLVVTFKSSDSAARKLKIGTMSPEETAYSTADGWAGVFVMSKPDFSAFQLPLLERPAPPAGTTPPAQTAPGAPPNPLQP